MGKFIWLIGENLSKTADNNGYYFWRGAVKKKDDIDKYLILEKNPDNVELYKSLPLRLMCASRGRQPLCA